MGIHNQPFTFMQSFIAFVCEFFLVFGLYTAQNPDAGYSREQLQPLTSFRQTHRRTVDGRLCAAAFVQNRETYTGCADAPNPAGDSGRPWCYVQAQILGADGNAPAWNYCAPGLHCFSNILYIPFDLELFCVSSVVDYDAMRAEAKAVIDSKLGEVRGLVARLQKTQRAAEQALDLSAVFLSTDILC